MNQMLESSLVLSTVPEKALYSETFPFPVLKFACLAG